MKSSRSNLTSILAMTMMTPGMSDSIKDLWGIGDISDEPLTIPVEDLPLSAEALANISKAEAKRIRKQLKRIKNDCLYNS